jgi:hypothetical protein
MILFFDTETTGLPKNLSATYADLENLHRLIKLAYDEKIIALNYKENIFANFESTAKNRNTIKSVNFIN